MKIVETLPAGTVKRIHVNRGNLVHNAKTGDHRPVYTVKHKGKTHTAHSINVCGPSFFNDPAETKPLPCGARVWLWTQAPVELWSGSRGPTMEEGVGPEVRVKA